MTESAKSATGKSNADIVAVIVGAIAAMGYSSDQIACIRPKVSQNWRFEGRLRGRI